MNTASNEDSDSAASTDSGVITESSGSGKRLMTSCPARAAPAKADLWQSLAKRIRFDCPILASIAMFPVVEPFTSIMLCLAEYIHASSASREAMTPHGSFRSSVIASSVTSNLAAEESRSFFIRPLCPGI